MPELLPFELLLCLNVVRGSGHCAALASTNDMLRGAVPPPISALARNMVAEVV